MKRNAAAMLIMCGMAMGAVPALAQTTNGWAGSLYAGYSKIMEDSDKAVYGVPGGGLTVHGNVFRMFNPVLGLGAELGYQHYGEESYEIQQTTGPAAGGTESGDAGFSSMHLTVQGIARGAQGKVRPFGLVGAGWYSLRLTRSGQLLLPDGTPYSRFEEKDSDGKFGANIGGGLQFKLSESAASFGIEARWHMIFDSWPSTDGTSTMDVMTIMGGVHFK